MSIINSTYTLDHLQTDGRRYVQETHTDSSNNTYVIEYLGEPNEDYATIMANRVSVLETILAEQEFNSIITP